jgi:signal transduction histidine kinase
MITIQTILKYSIFLMILCLFTTDSIGQKYMDSTVNVLKKLNQLPQTVERDSLIIFTYYGIIRNTQKPKSGLCLDSLRRFVEKSKWKKSKGYYYFIKGRKNMFDKEIYAAFNAFELALIEFRTLKDEENMLLVNDSFISLLNWNMIENELQPHVQKKYLNYMKETIELAKAKKDTAVWANVELTLGGFYIFVQKDFKNCILHGDNILKLVENKDRNEWFDYYYIALLGKSLAILNLDEPKGLKMIEDLRIICEKNIQNPRAKYVICQLGNFTGRYFLEKKDYKMAYKYVSIANKYHFFANFPYFENLLNKLLYECHKGLKNPSQAFKYLELVKKYEDEADHNKMNENYAEWQLKYDDEKQNAKIKTLENQKLQRENDKKDFIRNLLILSLLAGIGFVFYIYKNNINLRKKNTQLANKNREIQEALLRGQTLERKRVASELHDNLNTKLAALRWRLEAVDTQNWTEKESKNFKEIIETSNEVYDDVRLISHNMLPAELETEGLEVALQKLIGKLNNNTKIKFNLVSEQKIDRFSSKIEYEVYTVILELVNNIIKHSKAKQAWISLSQDGSKLVLSVNDDGIGIDENHQSAGGVGLRNLASRIENLNGKWEIKNQAGTSVVATIPV